MAIDDNFPDVPGALAYTTQRLKDELTRKGLLERFTGGNDIVQDETWTETACQIIKTGTKLATVENIDIAPTIAQLLEVPMRSASEHVLEEILQEPIRAATLKTGNQ
jgi:hypothetical protein